MKKGVRGAKSVAAQSVHNQLVTPHYNNKQVICLNNIKVLFGEQVKTVVVQSAGDMKCWIEELYYFNEEWNYLTSKEPLIKQECSCALGCEDCTYTKPIIKGDEDL